MLVPVHLEKETLIIQSFGAEDLQKWPAMVTDIYALLSDNQTLKYLPFKRLNSINDADVLLKNALLNLHCGRNYLHFIRKKSDGRIIGFIDVISPEMAREHYRLRQYPYFIEFCIKTEYSKKKVMSSLLPEFLNSLRKQRIGDIAAVINRRNIGAKKVLSKSGFSYYSFFDDHQDIYQFSDNRSAVA
ncbi:RimJ/RimL family protein N-acetyltransferase [Mucilaginibacter sp. SG538B]|uniref:GNAT family N-acetyltransferase n=1 Tax=Mucilaginibacter sp. SG538B TaxID=2587021 RepID=UPI00159E7876|nr:GNAT family N-acetyltransferase [Mucilaginibacter sp. SG538B]NVM66948.1 RimJ/RimL family protein N-acetyltransferase [Mucilaginibacter sp. SG538B]